MANKPDGAAAAGHAADTKDFLERTAENLLGPSDRRPSSKAASCGKPPVSRARHQRLETCRADMD